MANVPTIFSESPLDSFDPFDVFSDFRFPDLSAPVFGKHASRLMSTDVRETDKAYVLSIDLPGFRKDEISAELKNGYLTISARKDHEKKDQKEGRLIMSERVSGSCSRTFYVGDGVKEKDCSAGYEGGVLTVTVPKTEAANAQAKRLITIE